MYFVLRIFLLFYFFGYLFCVFLCDYLVHYASLNQATREMTNKNQSTTKEEGGEKIATKMAVM